MSSLPRKKTAGHGPLSLRSVRQLAKRTGLSTSSVNNAEHTENRGAVRLETLRRMADGLDSDLVYAIVPRHSLRRTIELQAAHIAEDLVGRVSQSREMEDTGVPRVRDRAGRGGARFRVGGPAIWLLSRARRGGTIRPRRRLVHGQLQEVRVS